MPVFQEMLTLQANFCTVEENNISGDAQVKRKLPKVTLLALWLWWCAGFAIGCSDEGEREDSPWLDWWAPLPEPKQSLGEGLLRNDSSSLDGSDLSKGFPLGGFKWPEGSSLDGCERPKCSPLNGFTWPGGSSSDCSVDKWFFPDMILCGQIVLLPSCSVWQDDPTGTGSCSMQQNDSSLTGGFTQKHVMS